MTECSLLSAVRSRRCDGRITVQPFWGVHPAVWNNCTGWLWSDTPFSFGSYQAALEAQGFKIREARDLSPHLKESYLRLADRTPKGDEEHTEHYEWLSTAYRETARAVDNKELGWGLFICEK